MASLNPWDIAPPSADNPGAKIVSLHRMADAGLREGEPNPPPSPAFTRCAIEARLNSRPRLVEIKPTWADEIAADWHDFIAEVRRSPWSHALVAVVAVVGWSVLLVAPLVLGEWWS